MGGIRPLWRIPGIVLRERFHSPGGRERIPEPMVMDDAESVAFFHAGGAANPGMRAVYDLCARSIDTMLPRGGGRLLDLGIGSGRALSAVLRRRTDITAVGVDLAPNMLATAGDLFAAEGSTGEWNWYRPTSPRCPLHLRVRRGMRSRACGLCISCPTPMS